LNGNKSDPLAEKVLGVGPKALKRRGCRHSPQGEGKKKGAGRLWTMHMKDLGTVPADKYSPLVLKSKPEKAATKCRQS